MPGKSLTTLRVIRSYLLIAIQLIIPDETRPEFQGFRSGFEI
jgi:hypothetical protein